MDYEIFARNILYFGDEEFKRLTLSSAVVVGVGALGCVVSQILVRSGIGKLMLIDKAKVDKPDLGRQALYFSNDIGEYKVDVAKDRLSNMVGSCEISGLKVDIREVELEKYLKGFNICIDCLDNYSSRLSLEDNLPKHLPLVHGGVERDYGQITTIVKGKTASLRDLYAGLGDVKQPIPVSTSAAFAVGSFMAEEAIKVILGRSALMNRLLVVELSDFTCQVIRLAR